MSAVRCVVFGVATIVCCVGPVEGVSVTLVFLLRRRALNLVLEHTTIRYFNQTLAILSVLCFQLFVLEPIFTANTNLQFTSSLHSTPYRLAGHSYCSATGPDGKQT